MLSYAATCFAQGAKGHGLVQEEAQLVLLAQLHQLRQRAQLTRIHVNALDDQEATRLLRLLWVLLIAFLLLLERTLQVLDVVVLEKDDGTARGIQALLYGKVDGLITGRLWDYRLF